MYRISAHEDSCVYEPPCVRKYPCIIPCLLCLGFRDFPAEGCGEPVLPHQDVRGTERETCVTPKVLGVLPQGGATDATQDNVMI